MGFGWAASFGTVAIYDDLGYAATGQLIRWWDVASNTSRLERRPGPHGAFMVRQLSVDAPPWPEGDLDLNGPEF